VNASVGRANVVGLYIEGGCAPCADGGSFSAVFLSSSCSLFTRGSLAASFTAGLQEANGGVPVSEVTKCRVRAVFKCALAARAKGID